MESPATPPIMSMKLSGFFRAAPLPQSFSVFLGILTKQRPVICEAHHKHRAEESACEVAFTLLIRNLERQ